MTLNLLLCIATFVRRKIIVFYYVSYKESPNILMRASKYNKVLVQKLNNR